jgi:hypothetical protein
MIKGKNQRLVPLHKEEEEKIAVPTGFPATATAIPPRTATSITVSSSIRAHHPR